MLYRNRLILLLAFLLFTTLAGPLYAQAGPTFNLIDLNLEAYPEIRAIVSVANFGGAPILDMGARQFEVEEDGRPLPIRRVEAVTNVEEPISIALVLDLSGSAPLPAVQAAAFQFLDHLGPRDQVSLIGFNTPVQISDIDPFKETDFTDNKDLIRTTIEGLTIQGQSAVYEAILKGILNTADETASRRAVLVMSDGFDTASRSQIADASRPRDAARDSRIPVFTVGIFSDDLSLGRDPDYLQILARESGGRYQEASNPDELGDLFQNVVDQLRLQYQLTFATEQPRDGQAHRLAFRTETVEGPVRIEETVRYPDPISVPEIRGIQVGEGSLLQPLPDVLRGEVLLVPEIESAIPLAQVEYQVNGETVQVIDLQAGVSGNFNPAEWVWDTTELAEGTYQLAVIATDEAGSSSTFTLETVQVGPVEAAPAEEVPVEETPVEEAPAESGEQGEVEAETSEVTEPEAPVGEAEADPEATAPGTETEPASPSQSLSSNIRIIIGVVILVLVIVLIVLIYLAVRPSRHKEPIPSQGTSGGPDFSSNSNFDSGKRTGVADSLGGAGGAAAENVASQPVTGGPSSSPQGDDSPTVTEEAEEGETTVIPRGESGDEEATVILGGQPVKPVLAVLIRQDGGKTYELREEVVTIGRTNDNQIVLKENSVSRKHARIQQEGDTFRIYDLGATNSAKVNGRDAAGDVLADNDEITLGSVTLIFKRMQ